MAKPGTWMFPHSKQPFEPARTGTRSIATREENKIRAQAHFRHTAIHQADELARCCIAGELMGYDVIGLMRESS